GTPWTPRRAAAFVESLARAVAEAHRLGLVHRDLKPANILLAADGTPKITDFGLAKSLTDQGGLTASDSILGSPSFMAPEQAAGKAPPRRPAGRRIRPGRNPLRAFDRPAAIQRRHDHRDDRAGQADRANPALARRPQAPEGHRDDHPQVLEQGARRAVSL